MTGVDLNFEVEGAEPVPYAAAPTLALKLRVTADPPDAAVHSVMLRCQIRIESTRRRYNDDEQANLSDLFGEPERWGETLRSMLWTHVDASVPPFTGETQVDLLVPCTFDFNIAATKYFDGLEDGEVPLCLLFSGTVFYAGGRPGLQIAQIPWEKEVNYRLSVRVWRWMMDRYYPNTAWLELRKDVFDRLQRYKSRCGLPTWEQALASLLEEAEQPA